MYAIDEKFVEELGLTALTDDEKREFANHISRELEQRVGDRLTSGMSDALLDEFGYFVDGDTAGMTNWFNANMPDFRNDPEYKQLAASQPGAPEPALMSQFGALKWLQLNRPDYQTVVQNTLEELRQEIIANRDAIMHGTNKA